ncbi:hypothetical protein AB0E01_30340 [Nocardia vinacea]|uniref:hypothetical protein n=1 Tax=Nocardia vinacea TaxID=96468 RepID=UPI0033EC01B0
MLSQAFRALGAVGEQCEHLLGVELQRIGREPDLEAEFSGVGRGELDPIRIPAHHAYCVAVQVISDDAEFPLDLGRVERLPGQPAFAEETGAVADALCAHGAFLRSNRFKVLNVP